ncbi:MAG: xylose isomerase [Elusimicrobiota bacterium]|nr:xylose isomerase [Elusimicrobiota bacterium]
MEYFPNVKKITFEGPKSDNPFAFRYYNPQEVVLGKSMKEHLRFAVAYWHTMIQDGCDPFGSAVNKRNWFGKTPIDTAKNRVDAIFEFLTKLDVDYFCFHDADIAPEGETLKETNKNIDEIVALIKQRMSETGKRLLWNTANMFSNPRFVHGAASSSNAVVFAHAAAQVKKGLEVGKELGATNYVFWGGREGYESLLNTDMNLEQDNMARFFHMAVDYAKEINFEAQFLIEPKPKEPTTHQYDFDCSAAIAFLSAYGLKKYFKLNIEANHATLAGHTFEHELNIARCYDMLGSIDANQGNSILGWDTDEFPTDLYSVTLAVYQIVENGGLGKGGINFDAKVRRSSFEQDDLFFGHIAGIDTFARGLKAVEKLKKDKFFENILEKRYASYKNGIGADIVSGKANFKTLEEYALQNTKLKNESDHLEQIKSKLNDYIF